MMADRILLVCTANECRSPYAGAVLHSLLREGGANGVDITTAGTHVRPGLPMCDDAAQRLPDLEAKATHRARNLVAEDVESASLILVAERRHRAAIVRISPTASARTFTLLEAAALGAASHLDGVSIASGESLEAFAARLHGARGLAGVIELDIADGHHRTPRRHRRTLDGIEVAASAIANALLGREPAEAVHESLRRSWRSSRLSRDDESAW